MRATLTQLSLALGGSVLIVASIVQGAQIKGDPSVPRVLQVSSVAPGTNQQLSALVAEIRSQADAFVFLSGGASRMQGRPSAAAAGYVPGAESARQERVADCGR